jgi:hypothetical protein
MSSLQEGDNVPAGRLRAAAMRPSSWIGLTAREDHMRFRALSVSLLLVLSGCELPFGLSGSGGEVGASLRPEGVQVVNRSSAVVHYQVIGEHSILDWVPCTRDDCPHLAPGHSVIVPFAQISGMESPTIDVYWWRRTSGGIAEWDDVKRIRLPR